jgi:hypothetical protein
MGSVRIFARKVFTIVANTILNVVFFPQRRTVGWFKVLVYSHSHILKVTKDFLDFPDRQNMTKNDRRLCRFSPSCCMLQLV